MKKISALKFRTYASYSIVLVLLILAEVTFYQFYYFVPITLNGAKLNAKKGQSLEGFLGQKNRLPKYGNLLDVEGRVIPGKKGNLPVIKVNGKISNLSHAIESDEEIVSEEGTDKSEKVVEKIEEVQSKIVYKGKGAFIYVIRKGRPGIRMIKRGQVSGKVVYGKWLVTPLDYTIGQTNIRYRKVVALTFDDGPSKYTSLIMKILKDNKVKASFFVLGQNIRKRPALLKQMARRHYTIGNHTFSHVLLKNSSAKIKQELKATDEEILKAAGKNNEWIRPPEGVLNSSAINFILKEGYKISLWNIDTVDWRRPSPKKIKERVLSQLKPGQVILMHDGGGNRMNTAAALPEIIKNVKQAGYRFVTLDELYRLVE